MKYALAVIFIMMASSPAFADESFVLSGAYSGDEECIGAIDTDDASIVCYMDVFSGSNPSFNLLPNITLDGNNLEAWLDSKQDTASAFNGVYSSLTGKPAIPATFDDLTAGATNKAFTATLLSKLNGVASGATANSPDATLENRANHTGTQAESTVVNLTVDLANRPTVYFGSMLKSNPVMYTASATVSSGSVVFQLTTDGTSTGTAIFPNGPNMDSINSFVSDATASYQMSYALTNSNKTLTITTNKLTTANILTGILGQSAANGAIVRMTVWGS